MSKKEQIVWAKAVAVRQDHHNISITMEDLKELQKEHQLIVEKLTSRLQTIATQQNAIDFFTQTMLYSLTSALFFCSMGVGSTVAIFTVGQLADSLRQKTRQQQTTVINSSIECSNKIIDAVTQELKTRQHIAKSKQDNFQYCGFFAAAVIVTGVAAACVYSQANK